MFTEKWNCIKRISSFKNKGLIKYLQVYNKLQKYKETLCETKHQALNTNISNMKIYGFYNYALQSQI